MNTGTAVVRLSALAQESRLALFRLLVRRGPEGLAASDIAKRLGIAPNTLSFHLKALMQAGLITVEKDGRFLFYAPNIEAMNGLVNFLTDNCCTESSSGKRSCP